MRVSGGHLCEAEAPTEAAAETLNLRPYSCGYQNFYRLGAAKNFDRCANPFSLCLALRALKSVAGYSPVGLITQMSKI